MEFFNKCEDALVLRQHVVEICSNGPLPFASKKDGLQLSVSSTKSDGSRRSRPTRKSSAPGRTRKEDKSEKYQFSRGKLPKSPNQEEILALFRRIQSTISKGEAKSIKQTNSNLSPTESILEVLRQSKKPIKDRTTKRGGDKVLVRKQGVPQKDHKTQNDVDHSASNFNLTRPPSNFVRRSPIPSPSSPRGNTVVSNSDLSKTSEDCEMLMLPRIEEMKLPELKELAKTRGFKGYSKLKKSELLELLRS